MRWAGYVARMGERRKGGIQSMFVGKSETRIQLGRPGRRWGVILQCIILFTSDCSPLSAGVLYGRLQRVTIPGAVIIQFVLLKMNIVLLETC